MDSSCQTLPKLIAFLFVNHKWRARIQIKHEWKPLLPKEFTASKRFKAGLPKHSRGLELDDLLLTQTLEINTVFRVPTGHGAAQREENLWWHTVKWRRGTPCPLQFACGCHQKAVTTQQWCNSLRICHNKVLFLIKKIAPCVFWLLQEYLKSQKWTRRHPRSFEKEEFSW